MSDATTTPEVYDLFYIEAKQNGKAGIDMLATWILWTICYSLLCSA